MTEKQIAEAIERNCGKDLDKIEQRRGAVILGIDRRAVLFLVVSAAEGRLDLFSEDIKKVFRERATNAKELAVSIDKVCNKSVSFAGIPEALSLQAQSLREYSKNLGQYSRKHGRVDHDQALPILVSLILRYRVQFNCWESLSRVIAEAYHATGRDAEARSITADKLIRAAKPYREGLKP